MWPKYACRLARIVPLCGSLDDVADWPDVHPREGTGAYDGLRFRWSARRLCPSSHAVDNPPFCGNHSLVVIGFVGVVDRHDNLRHPQVRLARRPGGSCTPSAESRRRIPDAPRFFEIFDLIMKVCRRNLSRIPGWLGILSKRHIAIECDRPPGTWLSL